MVTLIRTGFQMIVEKFVIKKSDSTNSVYTTIALKKNHNKKQTNIPNEHYGTGQQYISYAFLFTQTPLSPLTLFCLLISSGLTCYCLRQMAACFRISMGEVRGDKNMNFVLCAAVEAPHMQQCFKCLINCNLSHCCRP